MTMIFCGKSFLWPCSRARPFSRTLGRSRPFSRACSRPSALARAQSCPSILSRACSCSSALARACSSPFSRVFFFFLIQISIPVDYRAHVHEDRPTGFSKHTANCPYTCNYQVRGNEKKEKEKSERGLKRLRRVREEAVRPRTEGVL